jgi:hypothetical protein
VKAGSFSACVGRREVERIFRDGRCPFLLYPLLLLTTVAKRNTFGAIHPGEIYPHQLIIKCSCSRSFSYFFFLCGKPFQYQQPWQKGSLETCTIHVAAVYYQFEPWTFFLTAQNTFWSDWPKSHWRETATGGEEEIIKIQDIFTLSKNKIPVKKTIFDEYLLDLNEMKMFSVAFWIRSSLWLRLLEDPCWRVFLSVVLGSWKLATRKASPEEYKPFKHKSK